MTTELEVAPGSSGAIGSLGIHRTAEDHFDYLTVADHSQYALGQRDGRYFRVQRPFTSVVRRELLEGRLSVSLYMLTPDGRAIQGIVDSDKEDGLQDLRRLGLRLRVLGLKPVLVASSRGGHLHLFHQPMDLEVPVALLSQVMARTNVQAEIFPKRGLSCVRAIFARHPTTGRQYPVVDLDTLEPVAPTIPGQLTYLSRVGRASPRMMAEALAKVVNEKVVSEDRTAGTKSRPRREVNDLKHGLDILEVVGRDREVKKVGRQYVALCPFHDDHNPSLAIYPDSQRFHCFAAGCGASGDVIHWLALRQGLRDGDILKQLRGG